MESSGQERTFSTGAVRDAADKKPMLQLISPYLHFRLGEWLRFACKDRQPKPYPPRNWEKGMPFSETIGSIERHIQQYKLGSTAEDHLAAIAFGAMALMHYEEEIRAGRMDPAIDDMPKYEQQDEKYAKEVAAKRSELFWTRLINLRRKEVSDAQKDVAKTDLFEWVPDLKTVLANCIRDPDQPTFYIAGPMRGYSFFNYPAFDEARDRGLALGYNIISPADLDRQLSGIWPISWDQKIIAAHNKAGWNTILDGYGIPRNPLDQVIYRDFGAIMFLKPKRGDGIALLPGWPHSYGATAEYYLARWRKLNTYSAEDFETLEVG